jgi:DNA-binding transcriptional ArsR family regulator
MKNIERILKALANKRRLAIVWFLKREKEATVGQIGQEIKLSFKATSKHLSVLYSADIVEREQRGPHMLYRLAVKPHHLAAYIAHSRE